MSILRQERTVKQGLVDCKSTKGDSDQKTASCHESFEPIGSASSGTTPTTSSTKLGLLLGLDKLVGQSFKGLSA